MIAGESRLRKCAGCSRIYPPLPSIPGHLCPICLAKWAQNRSTVHIVKDVNYDTDRDASPIMLPS
jgi:rRNA maturation endonuclease Nob1